MNKWHEDNGNNMLKVITGYNDTAAYTRYHKINAELIVQYNLQA